MLLNVGKDLNSKHAKWLIHVWLNGRDAVPFPINS